LQLPIAQSRRIKEAVEFLEFMADPEVYNYVSFGLEGVHYYEENGEKFLTEEYENRRWQIYYTLVDTQEGFAIRLRDKGFKEYSDQVVDYCILENIDAYAPPLPELMDRSAELSEVIEEYYARFITGDLGLDRFDDFVRQWRRRGGDSVLEELNKWYEEYAG
jgi:putative aldouronate transport system substrate-binding protein